MKRLIIASALGAALILSTTTAMADGDDAGYFLLGTLFGSAITQPAYGYQGYYPHRIIFRSDYYGGGYYHRSHYHYRYGYPHYRGWHRSWRGDSWRDYREGHRGYRNGYYRGYRNGYYRGRGHDGDRDDRRSRHRGHRHGH